jgi:hypothetical protein
MFSFRKKFAKKFEGFGEMTVDKFDNHISFKNNSEDTMTLEDISHDLLRIMVEMVQNWRPQMAEPQWKDANLLLATENVLNF